MWGNCAIYLVLCILISITHAHDFRNFDDTIIFKINWPGKSNTDFLVSIVDKLFCILLNQTIAFATDNIT